MPFLAGRVTYERFHVGGRERHGFDDKALATLNEHAIGRHGAYAADGIEMGFTAGDHVLDLEFRLEKNVVNDALLFALRVDSNKIPNELLKAYTQMELSVLASENPSGYPTKRQRAQAKEAALERCQAEAQTGKFRKMKQFPVLWDARRSLVYLGATSAVVLDQFATFFKEAFGRTVSRITAGTLAHELAKQLDQTRALEDLSPAAFLPGQGKKLSVSWVKSEFGSKDFLGNEFLLWLWWVLDTQSDTLALPDGSTATCMLTKTLTLECPLAETGKETITHEAPTSLPEAKRGVMTGKLPRKVGLVVVRHQDQYELSLQAESLAVTGAALPQGTQEQPQAEREERIDKLRELSETIDLLFGAFCRRRLSSAWHDDLRQIRGWLKHEGE